MIETKRNSLASASAPVASSGWLAQVSAHECDLPGAELVPILVIGDPHYKDDDVEATTSMAQQIVDLAQERKRQGKLVAIIVLGDIIHLHNVVKLGPYTRAIEWLYQLRSIAPLYIIIGNHDRPSNTTFLTSDHAFLACRAWPNTIVVDKPIRADISGIHCVLVPYVYRGRFHEALTHLPAITSGGTASDGKHDGMTLALSGGQPHVYFGHQEIYGASAGGMVSVHGDKWPLDAPLLITGHFHKRHKPQPNVHYPGTPRQIHWDDAATSGVTIYHFWLEEFAPPSPPPVVCDRKEMSAISGADMDGAESAVSAPLTAGDAKTPIPRGSHLRYREEYIKLALPEKLPITLDVRAAMSYKPPPGATVKLKVTGSASDLRAFRASAEKDLTRQGVRIQLVEEGGVITEAAQSTSAPSASAAPLAVELDYSRLLYKRLQEKPNLMLLFHELWGAPSPQNGST